MSQAADLTARETEVIRLLRVLRSNSDKFVVIGGYAVSALAEHRFSVDCDIVISEKELKSLDSHLKKEGYRKTKASSVGRGIYGARTVEYVKLIGGRRVSADLFINSVVCRDTGGEWSYETLSKNSIEANVIGVTDSTTALVPRKELLIAMKLHPARDTDLRDIVIMNEGADWDMIAGFADTGSRAKLLAQLDLAIRKIGSMEFQSSIKAEFGLRVDVAPLIARILASLKRLQKQIKNEGRAA